MTADVCGHCGHRHYQSCKAVIGYSPREGFLLCLCPGRDPDCAICRLLPYGACDYHARAGREDD
jgi:hypothetical protein